MFKLNPHPVFVATVQITDRSAGQLVPLEINFRHRTNRELAALRARISAESLTDHQVLVEVIDSWRGVVAPDESVVPYTPDALAQLLDNYPAAGPEIWDGYLKARSESLLGN